MPSTTRSDRSARRRREPAYLCAVDESRRGHTYFLAVVRMRLADSASNRVAARNCLMGGERSIHMSGERRSRRRQILSSFATLPIVLTVHVCRISTECGEEAARQQCLEAFVASTALDGRSEVIIESRDSHRDRRDRRALQASLIGRDDIAYRHARHRDEPLLWIADAYAWAAGASIEWRRRLHPSECIRRVRP